ncbi:PepSY domain-containing protein [Waltera sp.]|uniref:PepSY domain-containing protein n=1 Tax=Waltera sp. TaxID=2815806 RepID=UPI003AB9228E
MMKRKLILTGAALSLAVAMTGCGGKPVINQQPSSQAQVQAQLISMEAAQEVALKAANIAAEDATISATTLNEVAGTSCYKVEFTSGDYAYAYTVNAETGAVMEMSSREKNAVDTQAQTETTAPAADSATTQSSAAATAQTVTGTVDEEMAQKIALEHAGVKATDATITKSKLDYEGRRQVYEIEWYAGGKKYDYEIAVDTGEILSSAYDEKTSGWSGSNSSNVTVSEADAKQTALVRVSGATEKDIYEWEFDYDDGRPEYEGKIIYGGTEYDFTIDASSGAVIEWETETVR